MSFVIPRPSQLKLSTLRKKLFDVSPGYIKITFFSASMQGSKRCIKCINLGKKPWHSSLVSIHVDDVFREKLFDGVSIPTKTVRYKRFGCFYTFFNTTSWLVTRKKKEGKKLTPVIKPSLNFLEMKKVDHAMAIDRFVFECQNCVFSSLVNFLKCHHWSHFVWKLMSIRIINTTIKYFQWGHVHVPSFNEATYKGRVTCQVQKRKRGWQVRSDMAGVGDQIATRFNSALQSVGFLSRWANFEYASHCLVSRGQGVFQARQTFRLACSMATERVTERRGSRSWYLSLKSPWLTNTAKLPQNRGMWRDYSAQPQSVFLISCNIPHFSQVKVHDLDLNLPSYASHACTVWHASSGHFAYTPKAVNPAARPWMMVIGQHDTSPWGSSFGHCWTQCDHWTVNLIE